MRKSSPGKLPTFLIIGAQKSGTTTVYRDLLTNPDIYFPVDKEPGILTDDHVLSDPGRSAYAQLYAGAGIGQQRGDASTQYSMLPRFPAVPDRARQVLGGDVKLIYVVREPLSRIQSHFAHGHRRGLTGGDINEEVLSQPPYLDLSRYAMQAEPWIEAFGAERLLVLRFEDYIARRRESVGHICSFLGVEDRPELLAIDAVYNSREEPVAGSDVMSRLRSTGPYRRWVRPLLSPEMRLRLRERLMPRPRHTDTGLKPETVRFILTELRDDLDRQPALFGFEGPLWDMDRVVSEHEEAWAARHHYGRSDGPGA